jgi:hypothetical protein
MTLFAFESPLDAAKSAVAELLGTARAATAAVSHSANAATAINAATSIGRAAAGTVGGAIGRAAGGTVSRAAARSAAGSEVFATLVEAPLALGLAHGAWEAFFLAGHFGLSHTGQLSETVMAGRLGELLDDARTLVPLRLALALALAPWMRLPAPKKFGSSAPASGAANAPTGSPTDGAGSGIWQMARKIASDNSVAVF